MAESGRLGAGWTLHERPMDRQREIVAQGKDREALDQVKCAHREVVEAQPPILPGQCPSVVHSVALEPQHPSWAPGATWAGFGPLATQHARCKLPTAGEQALKRCA